MKFGLGFAVFVIFFAVSAVEAFRTSNWLEVAFWLAIGVAFLAADNLRRSGGP